MKCTFHGCVPPLKRWSITVGFEHRICVWSNLKSLLLVQNLQHRHARLPPSLDCVNFGIYTIMANQKPDLVISGQNMGHNMGIGYVFSSGTIGAGLEANIAGVPSITISQTLPQHDFTMWSSERRLSAESQSHYQVVHVMIARVVGVCMLPLCHIPPSLL